MKKIFLSIISTLVFNIDSMHTPIVHSYAITDVLTYIDPTLKPEEILCVFDINNTIAETANQLTSPQWLTAMSRIKEQRGMAEMEAIKTTLPLSALLIEHCPLQPIESTTVALIKKLQDKGHKTLSLTARTPVLKACTLNHLSTIDIDFTRNSIHQEDIVFNDSMHYTNGVLFIKGGDKGECLLHLLKHIGYLPKQVIFIDDKEYNHHPIKRTLTQNDINHTCIWYRYCDTKVDNFDLACTQEELIKLCQQYPTIQTAYQKWLSL